MSDRPIGDHAFLSDCHSSALVATDGSVEWLVFPRFDSPSVCGRLLDDAAGHFRVGVADAAEVTRRYVDGSLVLETTFRTADGVLRLTDALAVGVGERGHELGRAAPHALLRHAVCDEGQVRVEVEFAPRPEYGFTRPLLCATARGVVTRGSPDRLALDTEVGLTIDGGVAAGEVELTAGEEVGFAMQWSRAWQDGSDPWDPALVRDRLDDTLTAWTSWADQHQGYDGPWRDLVRFSGAVLQGLTFQPTGAIVAAATTSLPETVGGTRNWDYRYAWLRDASMTSTPCGSRPVPTRPTRSCPGWSARPPPTCAATLPSRSCTGSPVNTTSPSAPSTISTAGGAAGPCASATARSTNASSTCTARSSTPCSASATSSCLSTR